jgi:hypothetical protein
LEEQTAQLEAPALASSAPDLFLAPGPLVLAVHAPDSLLAQGLPPPISLAPSEGPIHPAPEHREAVPPLVEAREAPSPTPPAPPPFIDRLWEAVPFDLRTLEVGVQRFLDQLGKAEAQFEADGAWGLHHWALAAVVAALAAELARRQWAREERPRPDLPGLPGSLLSL